MLKEHSTLPQAELHETKQLTISIGGFSVTGGMSRRSDLGPIISLSAGVPVMSAPIPVGKKLIRMGRTIRNPTGGTALITFKTFIGTDTIQFSKLSLNAGQFNLQEPLGNMGGTIIVEPGDLSSIESDVTGVLNMSASFMFDAAVPISTKRKMSGWVAGDNTLYACPTGKTAHVLSFGGSTLTPNSVSVVNNSGQAASYYLNVVKAGDVPSAANQITLTVITTGLPGIGTAQSANFNVAGICLEPGDYISVNSTIADAGQFAFVNVAEL